MKTRIGKAAPTHPGAFIREHVLDAHDLTVHAAADWLGVHRVTLARTVTGAAALSADLALRIERVFGVSADALMALQAADDLVVARNGAKLGRLKRFGGGK
jgi:addiction module HigA family antidote